MLGKLEFNFKMPTMCVIRLYGSTQPNENVNLKHYIIGVLSGLLSICSKTDYIRLGVWDFACSVAGSVRQFFTTLLWHKACEWRLLINRFLVFASSLTLYHYAKTQSSTF
jgi:hypothetical protein